MSLFNFLKGLPSFFKVLPQSLQFYPKAKKMVKAQKMSRDAMLMLQKKFEGVNNFQREFFENLSKQKDSKKVEQQMCIYIVN